jgi:hypothetical protein
MTSAQEKRGGTSVGFINELDGVEAASVIYLRLWCNGPDAQAQVRDDFTSCLGATQGRKTLKSLEHLCHLCAQYGRRPLMRHSVSCKCLGSDESCFANFIGTAAAGDRDDAMLIATLLVRPDVAPVITALAADFGLGLKRMHLRTPKQMVGDAPSSQPHSTFLH